MSKKNRNAWLIAGGALLAFFALNLLSAHLRSDCGLSALLGMGGCADDIRRAGFPWLFWESGGFAFHVYWSWPALLADAGLAVALSALAVWLAGRVTRISER